MHSLISLKLHANITNIQKNLLLSCQSNFDILTDLFSGNCNKYDIKHCLVLK